MSQINSKGLTRLIYVRLFMQETDGFESTGRKLDLTPLKQLYTMLGGRNHFLKLYEVLH